MEKLFIQQKNFENEELNYKTIKKLKIILINEKKNFLDLGKQPLANDFSKYYIPASFRLKLKFDTKLKLVMINKHIEKRKNV